MVDAAVKEIKNKKLGERFGLDEEWNMKKRIKNVKKCKQFVENKGKNRGDNVKFTCNKLILLR